MFVSRSRLFAMQSAVVFWEDVPKKAELLVPPAFLLESSHDSPCWLCVCVLRVCVRIYAKQNLHETKTLETLSSGGAGKK